MTQTNWEALKAMTDQEIEDRANADTEFPPLPAEMWKDAVRYSPRKGDNNAD